MASGSNVPKPYPLRIIHTAPAFCNCPRMPPTRTDAPLGGEHDLLLRYCGRPTQCGDTGAPEFNLRSTPPSGETTNSSSNGQSRAILDQTLKRKKSQRMRARRYGS